MKRLYTVNGVDFESKKDAKSARGTPKTPAHTVTDEVGRPTHVPASYEHEIHLGADHRLFAFVGKKIGARTHSHDARSGGHGNGFPNKKKR